MAKTIVRARCLLLRITREAGLRGEGAREVENVKPAIGALVGFYVTYHTREIRSISETESLD